MKKLVLILYLLTFNTIAQDVSMIKSEIFKDTKKRSSLKFSLEDEKGGLLTIRSFSGGMMSQIKGYYIQHFDSNLKLLKEVEYEVDNNLIKNAFIKDEKLHIIEYLLDKRNKNIAFNVVTAGLSDLKFNKKELISFSEKNQKKYFGSALFPLFFHNFNQFDSNHMGEVVLSSNNNYFVINFDMNNKDKEMHKIFVFNSNFEKVYDHIIQKNIKDKFFTYNSIDIDDNNGTVYFLGKSFENNSLRSKKKGKTNYHYELYKVNANGQENIRFKHPDKFIQSLALFKSSNRLACVGFYGNKDEDKINGVSLFNLNTETLKIEKEIFNPFSKEFLADKYGERNRLKEKATKKGLKDLDFRSVHLMDNGDLVVNAEEFKIVTHTSTDSNGRMSTSTYFLFYDIISVRIDKEGNLIWARNINKKQIGQKTTSYTSISDGRDSYYFINCADKIKKLSANRIAFTNTKSKKSNLYAIKINQEGDISYRKLIDDKESKVYYLVNNGNVNLKNKTVILTGKRKKHTRILKIKI